MQTLIEKLYEQKVGENGLYRMFSPDEIRIPARFPGVGVEGRIDCPGPKLPTEGIPLEVMIGYHAPQSLFVMYSFGIQDSQPFLEGYDLPGTGLQLHLHGPDLNTVTYGKIIDYDRNIIKEFNGYEASMASYNADTMGFKPFWP
ncbi:MAG: hypothetical protein Q8O03_01725 [Nanoarchaeota archaeon]|nr:hypothetical protein [Nanoarchaeota archaeon]